MGGSELSFWGILANVFALIEMALAISELFGWIQPIAGTDHLARFLAWGIIGGIWEDA